MSGPRPDPDPQPAETTPTRSWAVALKSGETWIVRADRLDALAHFGLAFYAAAVCVAVVPFGAYTSAKLVDAETLDSPNLEIIPAAENGVGGALNPTPRHNAAVALLLAVLGDGRVAKDAARAEFMRRHGGAHEAARKAFYRALKYGFDACVIASDELSQELWALK